MEARNYLSCTDLEILRMSVSVKPGSWESYRETWRED